MMAHLGDGRADATREADVVVFDQHRIEESGAVIRRASGPHRVLFKRAQGRGCLPGVKDPQPSSGRVDERAGLRGDAGEPL